MTTSAEEWDAVHAQRQWGEYPSEHLVRFVARHYGVSRADIVRRGDVRFLDLGCGAGANTWFLLDQGFAVDAVDLTAEAIERARRTCRRRSAKMMTSARFQVAAAESLPFEDASFDCVVDVCCLQHVEAIWLALAEVHRVLKPGGRLFSIAATDEDTSPSPVAFMRRLNEHARRQAYGEDLCWPMFVDRASFTVCPSREVVSFHTVSHWLISGRKSTA